jgi:endonuclease YncB( thermonuclease family)
MVSLSSLVFAAVVLSTTDGDTFKARIEVWQGVEVVTAVRVTGIDAPEVKGKCQAEKDKAQAAKQRLNALLASGVVTVTQVMNDKYAGRIDAVVMVDGVRVADTLIAEGLARKYTGGTRQGWCP